MGDLQPLPDELNRPELFNQPRRTKARRGVSVCYRGKTLLSTVDPVSPAERTAEAAPLRDSTLYFCPSPLFGYGLTRLLERIGAGGLDSAVLCTEADRELLALSLDGADSTIPPLLDQARFSIMGIAEAGSRPGETTEESAERICTFVRQRWGSRRFRRLEVLRFSGAWRLYPELYAAIAESLRGAIATDWSNAMTLVKLGRRYIRNFIRNLACVPRTLPLSSLSFGMEPVLVLGAGPSLDSFLDSLGKADRRPFRIVCVDTVIPCLKARNIWPDLVIALESQHWNLRDFVGARGWKAPLAMDLSALPATARVLEGPCYTFFTPWTGMAFFERLEAAGLLPDRFPPLGSVGLCAVAAALKLSRGPVIVCGVDFSFTTDSYHARSTPGHREKLRGQNRFRTVLNQAAAFRSGAFAALSKSGRPVRSDPAMRTYRDLFEREFAGESRLKDVEGSGLPLGLPTLSPKEALAILRAGPAGPENPEVENPVAGKAEVMKAGAGNPPGDRAAGLREFIDRERGALQQLLGILRGDSAAAPGEIEALLDFCDYLWAHFPECAAAGRRPPGTDTVFLKRIRAEIEPFIGLMEIALQEIGCEAVPKTG